MDQGGRPTKFRDEYIQQAEKLCRLGATDIEIADFFGIDISTLYRWKADREEFCDAIKTGKAPSDERVERSLFARANGYEHDEVDIRVIEGQIVQTTIRKYYPPDTAAAIFWLKNRRGWRDKTETGITDTEGNDVPLDPIEGARRLAFALHRAGKLIQDDHG